VLGLAPAILLVTGFIVWWRQRQRRRAAISAALEPAARQPVVQG